MSTMRKIAVLLMVCLAIFAQDGLQYAIQYTWGIPCSYDYTNVSSYGTLTCYADADCYNGVPLVTNWNNQWTCSYSVVEGKGESYYVQTLYTIGLNPPIEYLYNSGVVSYGSAAIFDSFDGSFEKEYHGQERADCDGYERYDEAYSYNC